MRILVIGGGIFLGKALIESAVGAGHEVTAFSRGRSVLPQVDRINACVGDRNNPVDLQRLAGLGPWDVVIDTCAYWPDQVRKLIDALREEMVHYTLISTVAAYADLERPHLDESSSLKLVPNNSGAEITAGNYGGLKAGCELEANEFAQRWVVRPGIIAGPNDPTDRFTYWVVKLSENLPVIVPKDFLTAPVQVIDVRDLAEWIVAQAVKGTTGISNAVGPENLLTGEGFLREIATGLGLVASCLELSDEEIVARGIKLESDFPFYIGANHSAAGLLQIDGRKAWREGLRLRGISQTARDTLAWWREKGSPEITLGWRTKK